MWLHERKTFQQGWRSSFFEPSTAAFTISVAATDYAFRAAVIPFLSKLRQVAPGIRVAARPVEDVRVETQFARGNLDLPLMTPKDVLPAHWMALRNNRYGVFSSPRRVREDKRHRDCRLLNADLSSAFLPMSSSCASTSPDRVTNSGETQRPSGSARRS
jgi:DNA-binding transcriptional LysR family regulator